MKKSKNICAFCEKDLSKEKFGKDYTLIPWRNDPNDPKSFNKIARCVHLKCLKEWVGLNTERFFNLMMEIYENNR